MNPAPSTIGAVIKALVVGELNNAGTIDNSAIRAAVDIALTATWPQIQEHFASTILTQNPDRDADFSAGVDWAVDTIRSN